MEDYGRESGNKYASVDYILDALLKNLVFQLSI